MDPANEHDYDTLPAVLCKDSILTSMSGSQVVLCFGETGCGKTSQIPQMIADSPQFAGKKVCVVLSSVFAAQEAAQFVSKDRRTKLGTEVACKVGLDDKASSKSRIIFMTDEILLREYLADRLLSAYTAIIIEDMHERAVNTDICCGILKVLCEQRPDLKLVITSVPHNAEEFQRYFPGSVMVHIPESVFPVDIFHAKSKKLIMAPDKNSYVQGALSVILKIHQKNEDGHILVYLPTIADIYQLEDQLTIALRDLPKSNRELIILPCHEGLTAAQLDRIHKIAQPKTLPSDADDGKETERLLLRKCVLVTGLPESGVHVPHVRFVVDSGYVKRSVFDPAVGSESEVVMPVSKSVSLLRASRAGTISAGQCYRLYSIETFEGLTADPVPAMQCSALASAVLYLKLLEVADIRRIDFLSAPTDAQLHQAVTQLHQVGALDSGGFVTSAGKQMAGFPFLSPAVTRMLIEAATSECDCLEEVTTIAAMLSVGNIWAIPDARNTKETARFYSTRGSMIHPYGDMHTYLFLYNSFVAEGRKQEWCQRNYLRYWTLLEAERMRARIAAMTGIVFRRRPQSASANKRSSASSTTASAEPKSLDARIATAVTAGLYMHQLSHDNTRNAHTFLALGHPETATAEIVLLQPSSVLVGIGATVNSAVFHTLYTGKDGVYVRHIGRADADKLKHLRSLYKPVDAAELCTLQPSKRPPEAPLKKSTSTTASSTAPVSNKVEDGSAEGWELTEKAPPQKLRQSFISIKLPPESVADLLKEGGNTDAAPAPAAASSISAPLYKKADVVEALRGGGTEYHLAVVTHVHADKRAYDLVYSDRGKEVAVAESVIRAASPEQKAKMQKQKSKKPSAKATADGAEAATTTSSGGQPTTATTAVSAEGDAASATADAKPARPASAPAGKNPKRTKSAPATATGPSDPSASTTTTTGTSAPAAAAVDHMASVAVGDIAEARHHQRWIPVRIDRRNDDGSFDVTPMVGKNQRLHHSIPANHLRPKEIADGDVGSPTARPKTAGAVSTNTAGIDPMMTFKVGEEVRVNFQGSGQWVTGTVLRELGTTGYEVRVKRPDGQTEDVKIKRRLLRPMQVKETAPPAEQQLSKDSSWSFNGLSRAGSMNVSFNRPIRSDSMGGSFDGELEGAGLVVGAKVRANYQNKGRWYPGTVVLERVDGTFDVRFDDGELEEGMKASQVKLLATELPPLMEGPAEQSVKADPVPVATAPIRSAPASAPEPTPIDEGDQVECYMESSQKWLPATVDRVRKNGTFDVDFADGKREMNVLPARVRRPQPQAPVAMAPELTQEGPLQEGDKVEGLHRAQGKWLPATIDRVRKDGTFDLDFDNGDHELRLPQNSVRRPVPVVVTAAPAEVVVAPPLQEGDKVEGNYRGKGKWYPATVDRVRPDGTFDLDYDDGEHERRVTAENVRRPGTASVAIADPELVVEEVPPAPIREGDKVDGNYRGKGKWYPATVDRVRPDGTFDLDYDDGESERRVPDAHVRRPQPASAEPVIPTEADVEAPVESAAPAPLQEGDKVEGNYRGKGKWYPATVDRVRPDGTFDLDYDDGENEKRMLAERVRRPLPPSVTTPPAAAVASAHSEPVAEFAAVSSAPSAGVPTVGSEAPLAPAAGKGVLKVGQKDMCDYRGKNRWYPGVIASLNRDLTYNIDYDDGEKELAVTDDRVRVAEPEPEEPKSFQLGDKVDVLYAHSNRKFPAQIAKAHADGTFDIRYDDGEREQNVPIKKIFARAKEELKVVKKSTNAPEPATAVLQEGDKVEGNYRGKGRWYPGRISCVNADGTYNIDYDDGEKETRLEASLVRAVVKAKADHSPVREPVAPLQEGDKVEGNYRGKGKWYPATVDRVRPDGTYDLDYDDGEREARVAAQNVRRSGAAPAVKFPEPVDHDTASDVGSQQSESVEAAEHRHHHRKHGDHPYHNGDKVEGNFHNKGKWIAAEVVRVHHNGSCDLRYDEIHEREKKVPLERIRKVEPATAAIEPAAPVGIAGTSETTAASDKPNEAPLQEGDKVEGNYRGKGKWYPATVDRIRADGTFDLDYDDGEREARMPAENVRRPLPPVVEAAAAPNEPVPVPDSQPAIEPPAPLQEGDVVEGNYCGEGQWLRATIDRIRGDGTYDLDYDNGAREVRLSADAVRRPVPLKLQTAAAQVVLEPEPVVEQPPVPLQEGDKVEGNYRGKGKWYPATVDRVRPDGTFDLDYDDGEREARMSAENVRRLQPSAHSAAAAAHPDEVPSQPKALHLAVGTRVEANYRNRGRWYPGHVKRPRDDGTIDIKYDDGGFEARVDPSQVRVLAADSAAMADEPAAANGEEGKSAAEPTANTKAPTRPEQPSASFASPLKGGRTYKSTAESSEPAKKASEPASVHNATSSVGVQRAVHDTKANYRNKGIWLPITHLTERENGVFDVVYEDGDTEKGLIPDRIFPIPAVSGAADKALFSVGQHVEVNYHKKGMWLPAVVEGVHAVGTYDVAYADGETEAAVPEQQIRPVETKKAAAAPHITPHAPAQPADSAHARRPHGDGAAHTAPASAHKPTAPATAAATPKKQVRYDPDVKGGTPPAATTESDAELAAMMDLQFFIAEPSARTAAATSAQPPSDTSDTASFSSASSSPNKGAAGGSYWDESVDFELSDDEVPPVKNAGRPHK